MRKRPSPKHLISIAFAITASIALTVSSPSSALDKDCDQILAKGMRFHTLAKFQDPVFPAGRRLHAELVDSDQWSSEGFGFQPQTTWFVALSERLGIGQLPARQESPAALPDARPGWATGFRFFYPDDVALELRLDDLDKSNQIAIRFERVDGMLTDLEMLKLLARLKLPYSGSGSSHYHDLQIHLYGSIAVPKFWWLGLQSRAQFLEKIAENDLIMIDPVVAQAVSNTILGVGYDVEFITSNFDKGVADALPGRTKPRSEAERSSQLLELLQNGGTGGYYARMGTRSLAEKIIAHIAWSSKYMKTPAGAASLLELQRVIAEAHMTDDVQFPSAMEILKQARANLLLTD